MTINKVRFWRIGQISILTLLLVSWAGSFREVSDNTKAHEGSRSLLGSYLAGRFAKGLRDTGSAAKYYEDALIRDPGNVVILEQAFLLEAASGNWKRVNKLSIELIKKDPSHRIARIFSGIRAFKTKKFEAAEPHFIAAGQGPIAELTAALAQSWLYLAQDKKSDVFKLLESSGEPEWMKFYKAYHLALISDLLGKYDISEGAYATIFNKDQRALRVASAYARHAAEAGNFQKAQEILSKHLEKTTGHPESQMLMELVRNETKPGLLVKSAQQGLAEVFYGLGDALTGEGGIDIGTIYLQFALYLDPDFPLANAALANVYETTKRYEEAVAAYDRIPASSPIWSRVQIRKSFNLNSLDRVDEAKVLLIKLADKYPDDIRPLDALGDILRSHKRYREAVEFYSRAIALIKKPEAEHWSHYYSRGVCYERLKDWDKAEVDLKMAMKLDPNRPLVLNYLGYSWVDQNLNLKQAMQLIRKAVQLKPDDGYFVDSLGWAHYRLGNYRLATEQLERAVELRPDDAVINDHLGDAYWRVGRRFEARYQWSLALSLKPEPEEAEKIKKKLEGGLDYAKRAKTVQGPEGTQPEVPE